MEPERLVTHSRLIADLTRLGLAPGQTVMLHASVKAIGWIVGGPDLVLEAILEVLGPEGTLMMLASWEDNPYELSCWPQEAQQAWLDEGPAYDPASSRADRREMGILTEYLRTRPGAVRSRHPFSYVALGRLAAHLTGDQPWQYRDGHGSPLEKLCAAGGKVLLLGSPLTNVTLLHYAEFLARVPDKHIDRYRMPVLIDDEKSWMDFEEFDTTSGIVDWPEDYFETIVKAYLEEDPSLIGRVGYGHAHLFDAADLCRFAVEWMELHFNP